MSYGDVQVIVLNLIVTLIYFPVLNLFFAFSFTFNLVLQRHDDVTSSSFKLKPKIDRKNIFEIGKQHLKKPIMINNDLIVFMQNDPGEVWWF